MKVLFLSKFYLPHVGGVEKHLENLSSQLTKMNFEVTILTKQYKKNISVKEVKNGVKIVRIPQNLTKTKFNIWKWIINNKNLINQSNITHAHDVFWWYLPVKFLYPNKPIYTTFHGYEGYKLPRWQAVVHRKIAETLSAGSICIGGFMKKWYYAKPNLISYGAANLKPSPLPKTKSAIFIGRLSPDTGILTYLQALKLLKDPIKLTVYGDGPQRKEAAKFTKDNNLSVTFKGFVENASQYISQHRYAFVSRYLSILEAQQTRRLVFAHYNNQIKKDYLTCHPQAKQIIIFKNPQDLAQELSNILKENQLEQTAINAAYRWAKDQTWEKLAHDYIKLWKKSPLPLN